MWWQTLHAQWKSVWWKLFVVAASMTQSLLDIFSGPAIIIPPPSPQPQSQSQPPHTLRLEPSPAQQSQQQQQLPSSSSSSSSENSTPVTMSAPQGPPGPAGIHTKESNPPPPTSTSTSMPAAPPNATTSTKPKAKDPTPPAPATQLNGTSTTTTTAKKSSDKGPNAAAAGAAAAAGSEQQQKISGAEMKKRAKAEKAARRAKEKQEREGANQQAQSQGGGGGVGVSKKGAAGAAAATTAATGVAAATAAATAKTGARTGQIPLRRGSVHVVELKKRQQLHLQEKERDAKSVGVFDHISWQTGRTTISGAPKEVHPVIMALGLHLRDYVVCGSSARCVAMLLAFKRVIESYTTPTGTSLNRHLTTYLSHQITYLTSCRPLSISQGNAIRSTKLAIASIDPSCPENEAKNTLCEFIDSFIREKITIADQVIANSAAQKIVDGDVILCFANSNVIQQTMLLAHAQGKKFKVSIIDSRPLFEGKKLARTLADAGLAVKYSLIHGLSHAVKEATKVFLGAHALTSNGRLFSRVGTALVAMSAKERAGGINIPVIVCCETVKFTDRVALDSIVVNEVAQPDELATIEPVGQVTKLPSATSKAEIAEPTSSKKGGKSSSSSDNTESTAEKKKLPLENWRERPNLQLLNIMYDVTPAEYIDMVITEMGSLPPSAVPIVHRLSTNS
ncbi:hypothetical protein AJ80_00702 [Polytolypa hystricis UAMH7299]|uniref:Translation initiation factor eIF2B subunit delta n=1 Tax=Polytolypa hystricis (strain UAMH7299) TaxID=1447883 RepID=A0A2B7Z4D1_POLH7|nr:hypothetical protein AJ80_00702 [Polytolypa hystricis UAMH7299]